MVVRPAGITPRQWRVMTPIQKRLARIPGLTPQRRAAIIAEEVARIEVVRAQQLARRRKPLTRTEIEFFREQAEMLAEKTPLAAAGTPEHKWRVIAGTMEPKHRWKVIREMAIFMGPETGAMRLKKDVLTTSWSQEREIGRMSGELERLSKQIEAARAVDKRALRRKYRDYYHNVYLKKMGEFGQKQRSLWERQWEFTGKELWREGATAGQVDLLKMRLSQWQKQKLPAQEVSRKWRAELKRMEPAFEATRFQREFGGRPEAAWEAFYKGPGQLPVFGWIATGFVRAVEPVGKGLAELATGRFISRPIAVRPVTARIPGVVQPFMIGGEVLGTYAMFAPAGRVVGGAARFGGARVAAVVGRVPTVVKAAPPVRAAAFIGRRVVARPRLVTGAVYGALAAGEALKVKAMVEAPMYSAEQIERRVVALREAGLSEQEISQRKTEMKRARAYSAEDIARSVGRDVGMFAGFGVGFRRGVERGLPVRYERVIVARRPVWRGITIARRPAIGRVPEGIRLGAPITREVRKVYAAARGVLPRTELETRIARKAYEKIWRKSARDLYKTRISALWKARGIKVGNPKLVDLPLDEPFIRQGYKNSQQLAREFAKLLKSEGMTPYGSVVEKEQMLRVIRQYLTKRVRMPQPDVDRVVGLVKDKAWRQADVILSRYGTSVDMLHQTTGLPYWKLGDFDLYSATPRQLAKKAAAMVNRVEGPGSAVVDPGRPTLVTGPRGHLFDIHSPDEFAKYLMGVPRADEYIGLGFRIPQRVKILGLDAKTHSLYEQAIRRGVTASHGYPGGPLPQHPGQVKAVFRGPEVLKALATKKEMGWVGRSPTELRETIRTLERLTKEEVKFWPKPYQKAFFELQKELKAIPKAIERPPLEPLVPRVPTVPRVGVPRVPTIRPPVAPPVTPQTTSAIFFQAQSAAGGAMRGYASSAVAASATISSIFGVPSLVPSPPVVPPRVPVKVPRPLAYPSIKEISSVAGGIVSRASRVSPPSPPPPSPPVAPPYPIITPPVPPRVTPPPPPPFILPGERVRRQITKQQKEFWEEERKRAFDVRVFLRDLMGGVGAGAR